MASNASKVMCIECFRSFVALNWTDLESVRAQIDSIVSFDYSTSAETMLALAFDCVRNMCIWITRSGIKK
jgi:hypothetical protein